MSRDIDSLPLFDNLVRRESLKLSDVWFDSLASLILTLQEYLSSSGIRVPRLTTDQRDALIDVVNGQLIYNTTTDKFQGYEAGNWVNLI